MSGHHSEDVMTAGATQDEIERIANALMLSEASLGLDLTQMQAFALAQVALDAAREVPCSHGQPRPLAHEAGLAGGHYDKLDNIATCLSLGKTLPPDAPAQIRDVMRFLIRPRPAPASEGLLRDNAWQKADWWWEFDNPDETDPDSPENIVSHYGPGQIRRVSAAVHVGDRFGFYLPAAKDAESDDDRWFWFATKREAEDALRTLSQQPTGEGKL